MASALQSRCLKSLHLEQFMNPKHGDQATPQSEEHPPTITVGMKKSGKYLPKLLHCFEIFLSSFSPKHHQNSDGMAIHFYYGTSMLPKSKPQHLWNTTHCKQPAKGRKLSNGISGTTPNWSLDAWQPWYRVRICDHLFSVISSDWTSHQYSWAICHARSDLSTSTIIECEICIACIEMVIASFPKPPALLLVLLVSLIIWIWHCYIPGGRNDHKTIGKCMMNLTSSSGRVQFSRKGIDSQDLNPIFLLQSSLGASIPAFMTEDARLHPLFRPATIAIHNDPMRFGTSKGSLDSFS